MTIGTPLWDEFVANLKEVKVTVEDMGFMPDNFPCESELKSMTAENGADKEKMIGRTSLHEWYSTYWRLAEIFQKKICHISTVTENKAKMKEG